MIWLFERDTEALRIETRYDQQSGDYVLVTEDRAGTRQVERFRTAARFRSRLETLEQQLEADRWARSGPFLLRDGWRV